MTPELTFFDLPHGRAALIESREGAALIDAGGAGQGLRIAETLRRRGIRTLTLLVVTADEPGALDGALELLPRVRPNRVVLPRCKFPSETRRRLEALLEEMKDPVWPAERRSGGRVRQSAVGICGRRPVRQ